MKCGCVLAAEEVPSWLTRAAGWLSSRRVTHSLAGRLLPTVALGRGVTGDPAGRATAVAWATWVPLSSPGNLVGAGVRGLVQRGATVISVSPRLARLPAGLNMGREVTFTGWGLHLAAMLRLGLALHRQLAGGEAVKAALAGPGYPEGRVALQWLARRVRYLSVLMPASRVNMAQRGLWERLWRESGVAVARVKVEEGEGWDGDLVVWVGEEPFPEAPIRAPVCIRLGRGVAEKPPAGAVVVEDGLFVPPLEWRADSPARLLPAAGTDALVWAVTGKGPYTALAAATVERIWAESVAAGFRLVAALARRERTTPECEPDGKPGGNPDVGADGGAHCLCEPLWLTRSSAAHIIGDAI